MTETPGPSTSGLESSDRIIFELSINGVEPDFVSSVLGLSPSATGLAGTSPRPGAAPLREHFWTYCIEARRYSEYDEKLLQMFDTIQSRGEAMKRLPPGSATLCIVVYRNHCEIGAWVPAEIVSGLGSLGISIELDGYALPNQPAH